MSQRPLGRDFNVISEASGIHIPLNEVGGVTFVSFVSTGDNTLTLKESIAGASEQNLVEIDTVYKAPGIGGTWTKVVQTAAATFTNADATNDMFAIYVRARSLSDGFDSIEATVDAGTCFAILHDLAYRGAPEGLASSV